MRLVDESPEKRIRKAIAQNGQFTHNIISCVLRVVHEKEGLEAANALVRKFKLDARYGISEVKDVGTSRE